MDKQFKLNKITDAIDDLSVNIQREAQMSNEGAAGQVNELDAFNSGCDLVLTVIETRIIKLEQEGGTPEQKYSNLLKTLVDMRNVVENRRAPKVEEPAIMVPDSKIIIAS
jgi:hypothetical protein